ncbi:MAG: molybdopterin-dependent oxidoreductase [Candidatus Freyarchaeota archaeon]
MNGVGNVRSPDTSIDVSEWFFTISGLVKRERKLGCQEFASLPRVRVFSDVHCVTGWSKFNNLWEGVSSGALKELVDILPNARFVMVHSAEGHKTNLSLSDFFEPDVLFAFKHFQGCTSGRVPSGLLESKLWRRMRGDSGNPEDATTVATHGGRKGTVADPRRKGS